MSIRHPVLNPCSGCGCDRVDYEADGIGVTYTCADCGAFVAELMMGAEP